MPLSVRDNEHLRTRCPSQPSGGDCPVLMRSWRKLAPAAPSVDSARIGHDGLCGIPCADGHVRFEGDRPPPPTRSIGGEMSTLTETRDDEHSRIYFQAAATLAELVDAKQIDRLAKALAAIRTRGGRLFLLGVGGGAGHASHAVNDFRKLCAIESYAPTDNVSELTARTNDDGWESSFTGWLEVSRLGPADGLLVFSVGGGSRTHGVSVNLVNAIELAQARGAAIYGVVGAPGGTLGELGDLVISIDPPPTLRTPLVESFQAVVWHALVSHPDLAVKEGHWESLASSALPNR
jgi:D-sedoheptulose 7-phosphate isomerase